MENLAIVGKGIGYKNALVSGRKIWTVESAFKDLGKADKVFRLHNHEKQLQELEGIEFVYMNDIPFDKLVTIFGELFHSSIAWMLGYAYIQGYRDIMFFGIDMAVESEYGKQRDGLNRLIGKLEIMGVNIIIPEWSMMYIPPGDYELTKEN